MLTHLKMAWYSKVLVLVLFLPLTYSVPSFYLFNVTNSIFYEFALAYVALHTGSVTVHSTLIGL